jgi:hypothetical protein
MENKYIIVDLKTMDFMKDKEGQIVYYDTEHDANMCCGMYEFEDVWVLKLIYNYKVSDENIFNKKSNRPKR